ncbi:MAG: molecular chaperone DjiA [Pseudomonadota bacterium]
MSVWRQLGEFLSDITTEAVTSVVEAVRTVFEGDPQRRRNVGFSVAIIALSAKMAKADGVVTEEEVSAFQEIFKIPKSEFNNVSRLYNLAKQDVAGFHAYAEKVRDLFPEEPQILEDVMDGLFHIANADGLFHESEKAFMDEVATIFGIVGRDYARIKNRHLGPGEIGAYKVLDADPAWDNEVLKLHYRKQVIKNHPDRMIARGVPAEFVAISNERLAKINRAWELIKVERGLA